MNIMLTCKGAPASTLPPSWADPKETTSPLSVWLFPICRLAVGYFVLDVLLDEVWIGADDSAAIHENCGGAADFELLAVRAAGIHSGGGFRAGQAGLQGRQGPAGLPGKAIQFCPDVRRGGKSLAVVD